MNAYTMFETTLWAFLFGIICISCFDDIFEHPKLNILFKGNNRRLLTSVLILSLIILCKDRTTQYLVFIYCILSLYLHLITFIKYNELFKKKYPFLLSKNNKFSNYKYINYLSKVPKIKKNIGRHFYISEFFIILSVFVNSNYQNLATFLLSTGYIILIAIVARMYYMAKKVEINMKNSTHLNKLKREIYQINPQVLLHFGSQNKSQYQLNMWISTLKRLNLKTIIVVRKVQSLELKTKHNFPVLFVHSESDIEYLIPSSCRVGLFTGNTANNLVVLRLRFLTSIFIGHGDSDKVSSSNNVTKMYDYVFVAGKLAIQRYINARVKIPRNRFIIVGRPQLDSVLKINQDTTSKKVLLYTPTFEGWNETSNYCSVQLMKNGLDKLCQTYKNEIKFIFRPHPYLGCRVLENKNVMLDIISILKKTGVEYEVHLGSEVDMYNLFNISDILISDVSSVISDFYASEKPAIVFNTHNTPENIFLEENPSAGGCYIFNAGQCFTTFFQPIFTHDPKQHERKAFISNVLSYMDGNSVKRFNSSIKSIYKESLEKINIEPTEDEKKWLLSLQKNFLGIENKIFINDGGSSSDNTLYFKFETGWINPQFFNKFKEVCIIEQSGNSIPNSIKIKSTRYSYKHRGYAITLRLPVSYKLLENTVKFRLI